MNTKNQNVNPEQIKNTMSALKRVFSRVNSNYWLSFGALWALIRNNGILEPKNRDFDICVPYGLDYKRLEQSFRGMGYKMSHAMVDDTRPSNALHCGFDPVDQTKYIHICVAFLFPREDMLWYCQDSTNEIHGVASPNNGYYFRGFKKDGYDDDVFFRMVEWPGIDQMNKIRVPRFPGTVLDTYYPDWGYKKQRYNITKKHEVIEEKMQSYHQGGVVTKYAVWVKSMADWNNKSHVEDQLRNAQKKWITKLKGTQKK